MTERRLHAPDLPEHGGPVALASDAVHHARVLRLAVGDPVVLFDGSGGRADGRITRFDGAELVCEVGPREYGPTSGPRIHLVQALPRAGKLDDLVRMTTELGVAAIHLAVSERSVSRLEAERGDKRRERLTRIAVEAARQCERDDVPVVHAPATLDEVAARAPREALRVVACGRTGETDTNLPFVDEAYVVVGPEGGLSSDELRRLAALGYRPIALGAHVLRVETAAPVAVALVLDRMLRSKSS